MSDVQFKSVLNKMRSTGSGDISYPAFLDAYQAGTGPEKSVGCCKAVQTTSLDYLAQLTTTEQSCMNNNNKLLSPSLISPHPVNIQECGKTSPILSTTPSTDQPFSVSCKIRPCASPSTQSSLVLPEANADHDLLIDNSYSSSTSLQKSDSLSKHMAPFFSKSDLKSNATHDILAIPVSAVAQSAMQYDYPKPGSSSSYKMESTERCNTVQSYSTSPYPKSPIVKTSPALFQQNHAISKLSPAANLSCSATFLNPSSVTSEVHTQHRIASSIERPLTCHSQLSMPSHISSSRHSLDIAFNDKLVVSEVKPMGDLSSGDSFMYRLREAVTNKFYHIARHLSEIDYAKIGVVSRDDFYDVIAKHCFRMPLSQFEDLWKSKYLKVNEFGNVDYRHFLKTFSSEMGNTVPGSSGDGRRSAMYNRPATGMSNSGLDREMMFSRSQSRANSRAGSVMPQRQGAVTPMVNAESVESRIKSSVQRNWKRLQEHCRIYDPEGSGEVEASQFKELCDRFRLPLQTADFHLLVTKYDIRNNGKFNYTLFLKHFVLALQPTASMPGTAKSGQRKLLPDQTEYDFGQTPTKYRTTPRVAERTTPGLTSDQFYMAMLRIRDNVLSDWKDMRRQFRQHDKMGTGAVPPFHFRNVLRQFHVNLSEDEFYHLMTYYDKGMTGNINYNDFIGHFLRAT